MEGTDREVGIQVIKDDKEGYLENGGFYVGGKIIEKGLDRALPSSGKVFNNSKLGNLIFKQGAYFKVIGAKKVLYKSKMILR